MELFNQLTLCNILNGKNDLGTPELRAAVASMSEEQKDNVLVFLECNTEELAGLPNGRGIQANANCRSLLDYLPTLRPNAGANSARIGHRSAYKVASSLLPKFENFLGKVKDGFKFIEKFKMKSVGMTEPKHMATSIALSGIATASWFERESFKSYAELEEAFKKTWCTKLNPSDAIACVCQTFQKEDGYIREYIVKFEELKRFFGDMSLKILIDMFMRNTWRAVHDSYKELKRQELTWEQFLTEVTVIDDEEARWDSSKRKEDDTDKKRLSSSNKRAKASKKKTRNGLSERAEEFRKELNISKEE